MAQGGRYNVGVKMQGPRSMKVLEIVVQVKP